MTLLCGFQGSGKSTVGEALARRWNCPFIDTDHEIEALCGSPIPELYKELGWRRFREIEKEIVANLPKEGKRVIALGGGTLLDRDNQKRLEPLGPILYLELPLSLLRERWEKEPSFAPTPEMQTSAFADRVDVFQTMSTHTIAVAGMEVEEVVEEVIKLYGE